MGHYHRIVNLTQHAVIEPMDVGVLDKLLEFGLNSASAMAALWLLLGREAWCGDRIAILGYEGRSHDLAPEVIAETGLDGTAYYKRLENAGQLARDVLVERGICTFTSTSRDGVELWRSTPATEVSPARVDVVAANLDRRELLDPAEFGDSRDLDLAAWTGGYGGVTTALAVVLAASNQGGSRGGGDVRSTHPLVGAWAGDHVGIIPCGSATGFADVSGEARSVLAAAGEANYTMTGSTVERGRPPSTERAIRLSSTR